MNTKTLLFKTIAILIGFAFLVNAVGYATPQDRSTLSRSTLRVPASAVSLSSGGVSDIAKFPGSSTEEVVIVEKHHELVPIFKSLRKKYKDLVIFAYDYHRDKGRTDKGLDEGNWVSFLEKEGVEVVNIPPLIDNRPFSEGKPAHLPDLSKYKNRKVFVTVCADFFSTIIIDGGIPAPYHIMGFRQHTRIDGLKGKIMNEIVKALKENNIKVVKPVVVAWSKTYIFDTSAEYIEAVASNIREGLKDLMNEPTEGRIDLHSHTTESDGYDSPTEMISKAKDKGLLAVGKIDHNAFGGLVKALEAGQFYGIDVIPGVEFSLRDEELGLEEFHLLAYFDDKGGADAFKQWLKQPEVTKLVEMAEALRAAEVRKTEAYRLAFNALHKDEGLILTEGDIRAHTTDMPHRYQLGMALLSKYGEERLGEKDFRKITKKYFPCELIAQTQFIATLDAEEVIPLLIKIGAVLVLAHPAERPMYKDISVAERLLTKYRQTEINGQTFPGITGVEAYASKHKPKDNAEILALVDRLNSRPEYKKHPLFITLGTDAHHQKGVEMGLGDVRDNPDGNMPSDRQLHKEILKELKERIRQSSNRVRSMNEHSDKDDELEKALQRLIDENKTDESDLASKKERIEKEAFLFEKSQKGNLAKEEHNELQRLMSISEQEYLDEQKSLTTLSKELAALIEKSYTPAQIKITLASLSKYERIDLVKFYLALNIARSKIVVSKIKSPTKINIVFPVYSGINRLKRRSEHIHGEDYLRVKIAQLEELFGQNPNISWQLIVVDDGSPYAVGKANERIMREEYPKAYAVGKLKVIYLQEEIDRNLKKPPYERDPVLGEMRNAQRDSRRGGATSYGLIYAAREGADYVIDTDADVSAHLGQSGLLLEKLIMEDYDLAIGSRRMKESVIYSKSLFRKVQSWVFNHITRSVSPIGAVKDTQCGFKGYTRRFILDIVPRGIDKRFSFYVELILLARLLGYKTKEVPITWLGSEEESSVSLKDVPDMLRQLIAHRRRHLPGLKTEFAAVIVSTLARVADFAIDHLKKTETKETKGSINNPKASDRKNILVVGGAGYIGTFVTRHLLKEGYNVIIYDNLSTGHRLTLPDKAIFVEGDLSNKDLLNQVMKDNNISAVIHLAALIEARESVKKPAKYFYNNLVNTLTLLEAMVENNVKYIVFSSSAAVYGDQPDVETFTEAHATRPNNPYGETKLLMEKLLEAYEDFAGVKHAALRYFNAAGAAMDGSQGEVHIPETHLIPGVIKSGLSEKKEVDIHGADYQTPDGTAIRDYIHVEDLAKGHTLALEFLLREKTSDVFNLGTGKGNSVKEVVDIVEEAGAIKFKRRFSPRSKGGVTRLVASYDKAKQILGWQPEIDFFDIVRSAWWWYLTHPQGYADKPKPRKFSEKDAFVLVWNRILNAPVLSERLRFDILFRLGVDLCRTDNLPMQIRALWRMRDLYFMTWKDKTIKEKILDRIFVILDKKTINEDLWKNAKEVLTEMLESPKKELWKPAFKRSVEALKNTNERESWIGIIEAVIPVRANLENKEMIMGLIELLKDKSLFVREMAAFIIGEIRPRKIDAEPYLLNAFAEERVKTAKEVISEALDKLKSQVSVPAPAQIPPFHLRTSQEISLITRRQAAEGPQYEQYSDSSGSLKKEYKFYERFAPSRFFTNPIDVYVRREDGRDVEKILIKGGNEYTLWSEYICQRFYALLGLPVPKMSLVKAPLRDRLENIVYDDSGRIIEKTALAIEYMEGYKMGSLWLPEEFHNDLRIQGALFLSILLAERDRWPKNMLFWQGETKTDRTPIYHIDFGASLFSRATGRFTRFDIHLSPLQMQQLILTTRLGEQNIANEAYADAIKDWALLKELAMRIKAISDEHIEAIIDSVNIPQGIEERSLIEGWIEQLKAENEPGNWNRKLRSQRNEAIATLQDAIHSGGLKLYLKQSLKQRRDDIFNIISQGNPWQESKNPGRKTDVIRKLVKDLSEEESTEVAIDEPSGDSEPVIIEKKTYQQILQAA